MAKLTKEQQAFLNKHRIAVSSVFDATGLGKSDYRRAMKSLGMDVAIGVTPCQKSKHTLRSRSGHCIQCNTAALAFQSRYSQRAYVYVAGSAKLMLVKIGFASDVDERIVSLNELGYAGTSDWKCLYELNTKDAGRVEYDAQILLRDYARPTIYLRNNKNVDCLETFSCGATIAIDVLRMSAKDYTSEWISQELDQYNFDATLGDGFTREGNKSGVESAKPLYRVDLGGAKSQTKKKPKIKIRGQRTSDKKTKSIAKKIMGEPVTKKGNSQLRNKKKLPEMNDEPKSAEGTVEQTSSRWGVWLLFILAIMILKLVVKLG